MKNNKLKEILISELEVSIKTRELLADLSIKTLAELFQLPKIYCDKRSALELEDIFKQYEVNYLGEFITPKGNNIIPIQGDVTKKWNTIRKWMNNNHPSLLFGFSNPASKEQIKTSELQLHCELPEDYKAFLNIHNGQVSDTEPMVRFSSLMPIEKVVKSHKELLELFDDEDEPPSIPDEEIQPLPFSKSWIPIGNFQRNYLCIDMEPSEKGNVGQIILIMTDNPYYELISKNFTEFLSLYFEQLQTGEIEIR